MLYIVKCEVEEHRYMDGKKSYETTHIVEAENSNEVYEKVKKYYKDKDDPYYMTYWVSIIESNECIK